MHFPVQHYVREQDLYLLPCLHLEICRGKAILSSDHLVVRQDKGAVVVVFLRIVGEIQPTTQLLLHVLHTLRQEAVEAEEVGVVLDQEDLEEVQTLDQEGLEVVQILDQVVVEEDMETLVVAIVGQ